MTKIVECVPNFSEGRRSDIIDAIVAEIIKVDRVRLLDREMDKDHNRSVITFIGPPEAVKRAAFAGCAKATELINMEEHKGEHPRVGATDVIPFIPMSEVTMEDCVKLANELAQEIAEKLSIPVYLYEEAAKRPDRRDLANIRKGQYEALKTEIGTNPDRRPDYGPTKLHPTAGATVVGARMPLIAYNVNLGTTNVEIAKKIAKAVRSKSGGLRYVKAMGFEIKEKGCVQVSMNLVNYLQTPIFVHSS
jgi:glutamate formiminotransferase